MPALAALRIAMERFSERGGRGMVGGLVGGWLVVVVYGVVGSWIGGLLCLEALEDVLGGDGNREARVMTMSRNCLTRTGCASSLMLLRQMDTLRGRYFPTRHPG